MSLSNTRLSSALRSGLLSANIGCVNGAALTAMCDAIAAAVVTEVTTNAVVIPTALVAPGGGGPVTGTGTLT